MEDAVEAVLGAVAIAADVAPGAAVADVPSLNVCRQPARSQPLHQQLRIGMDAVKQRAWRVELATDQRSAAPQVPRRSRLCRRCPSCGPF